VRVTDRSDERRGTDQVHAWHCHQPADLGPRERLLGDPLLDRGDLLIQELDVSHRRVDRLALLQRQLQAREPLAALDSEQIRARRLDCSRRCNDAWTSFFARVRERTSCSRRDSRRRRIRQRSSGIHTASSSPFHNRLANVCASSLSVLALALAIPVSSGDTTTTRLTCGSSSRTTSQQLPVTSNATLSDPSKLAANASIPSGVAGTRPAERVTPS